MLLFLSVAFVSITSILILSADAQVPIPNVAYGLDPAQVMDVYLPLMETGTAPKIIVLIHGGAWGAGEKSDMNGYVPFLMQDSPGHYVANMEYRLGTHQSPGFPKQLDDVHLALGFLQALFPGRNVTFALMGVSAGGHLSMLYGYSRDIAKVVKAAVSIVGPTDLTDPAYVEDPYYDTLFLDLVGNCLYTQCPELYNATSPVTHVTAEATKTIGFYGNADILIPNSQMPLGRQKLEEFGVVNKFTVYPGGHADWEWEYQMDMMAQIAEFFNTHW